MIHTIKLSGYKASPGFLRFGTVGSYGVEQMQFVLGDDWKDFAIKATFTNPWEKSTEVYVPADTLLIDVPPEATAGKSGTGQIAVVGYADGVQIISTKILYGLDNHAPIEGSTPTKPTTSLLQQVLTATGNAELSAKAAKDAAEQAKSSASAAAASAAAATSVVKPFADTAENAAVEAVSASKAAQTAQTAATASADAAASAAVAAGNAASAAVGSEQAAGASELKAAESEKAAAESAQAALESKTAAETSEKNAAASAKQAKDIADSLHADYTTTLNEIAALKTNKADKTELETVKQQVESITPDNSTIGEKPWSSKNIIDMLCPKIEESGNPVQCYPVAGYPLGVKAKWEPMQEGSGTPSPENIRHIKGRDSATVERCGENLLNPKENNYFTYTPYDLTITYIGDNKVHLKGTYNNEGGGGSFVILDSNQKLLAGRNLKITGFTIEGTKQAYRLYGLRTKDETVIAMNAEFTKGDVIDMTVAIVVSKDTPSAYIPYTAKTTHLTLPETVYGGEVDAVSGEGKQTWKLVTLDGTENWFTCGVNANNATVTGFYSLDVNDYKVEDGNVICSHLPNSNVDVWGGRNEGIGLASGGSSRYLICGVKTKILDDISSDVNAIASWKAYLAAQYAAGTPVQVCYKLATPAPFTATGGAALPALDGANTVITDADSVDVTGRADPIKRIADLEAAVASIE